MERNLTRSWFYAEFVMGHCWRRWHNQIDCILHGSQVCKNFWNSPRICIDLLSLVLNFSNLRHHLLVKMTVEKTVKTGSDVKSKTNYRFLLILTRWTRIYAYLVILAKTNRYRTVLVHLNIKRMVYRQWAINKMTECSFNALAFLFFLILTKK